MPALGDADNWDAVLRMYADVNAWCGDIIKVTPSSKSVGDIALFLLKQGITKADLAKMERMQALSWPQSAIELARGEMGKPHFGFPKEMQDAILKGQFEPLEGRPGDTLEPEDFEKVKKAMEEEFKGPATEEDVQAFLMYPAVFRGYMKHLDKAGPLVTHLPTPAFFYGLEVGESIVFSVPGESVADAEEKCNAELPLTQTKIELTRVGPLEFGDMRSVEWLCDGAKHVVKVKDPSTTGRAAYDGPMAEAGNKGHVPCPLPGIVGNIAVSEGANLKKDDVMFTIVAMKMEVMVRAPADCSVTELCVQKDQEVVDGALLAKVKAA